MPWTIADVDSKKAGLSAKQKRQWVEVANSALERCLADGRSQKVCEASAIKQANSVVGEPELKEAATIKSRIRGFLKAAQSLLGEKTLPKPVRAKIEGLRADMKKTWKDLESETLPVAVAEAVMVDGVEQSHDQVRTLIRTKIEEGMRNAPGLAPDSYVGA